MHLVALSCMPPRARADRLLCVGQWVSLLPSAGLGFLTVSIINQVAKVNILLQSYISKAEVDGFALVADMNHVVQARSGPSPPSILAPSPSIPPTLSAGPGP